MINFFINFFTKMLFYSLSIKQGRITAKENAAKIKASLSKVTEMNARAGEISILDSSTNAYTTFVRERKK
ncbi:hypothetical protein FACS189467_7090 [Bacteroidia bacterium]|nr:hypothetical protein FACS189467_7090 [Bacteroidia bacterium]